MAIEIMLKKNSIDKWPRSVMALVLIGVCK